MTLDLEMAEIAKVFFAESREGLDQMESGLLTLDTAQGSDNIDTIFRAAHSIKGGSATFGFREVAAFTHGVETLLDEMRNGARPATTDIVQTLLQACDCLRDMIAATQAQQPLDQQRMSAVTAAIDAILAARPDVEPAGGAGALAQDVAPLQGWNIRVEPAHDFFRSGNDPLRIFAQLARLGACSVQVDASGVPPLDTIDPEACYLGWTLDLSAAVTKAQVDDVFAWVDDRCRIVFAAAAAPLHAPGPQVLKVPAPAASVAPRAAADAASIRVATEKLDNIINLVGELLITQSMLCGFADGIEASDLSRLRQGLAQLARNTRELQESVMQIRMLPISFAFNRFPRLVHDLSRQLGKKVEIKLTGEGTELDKTVLEKINDPLVHLVRNALDHGLETPERRLAAGKQATGTLELKAFHEGGNIIIEVRDDGAGLDKTKILNKARERSLVGPDQQLTAEQIDDLIFLPGFSTAERVSDVSGRGVGMDVVRRNIHDLGGHVHILSNEGAGSTVRIRLPLTLAILDGQLVRVGREIYIISLLAIVETIQVKANLLNTVAGRSEMFRLRGEYLPVIKLREWFGIETQDLRPVQGLLVVMEADGTRVGVLVDDLLAQQQVVIKSLEANFKPVPGIAGATILGDGSVALIIDAPGLIRMAAGRGVGVVKAA